MTGAFGTVPGLLLLPYLTDQLGVAAGVAGLLVLAPKAWDVVVNPIAGRLSDRTRGRLGARRPYVLAGGLAVAVLFVVMFAGPLPPGRGAAAFVAVAFMATATAFAFYQVPFVAMPAEMTEGYAERTRLMTWRVAVLALAILISGGVSPALVAAAGGGLGGYRMMALFVAGLIAVGAVGAFLGTTGAPTGPVLASEPTLRAQLAVAAGSRPFRRLLACFVVQAAATATMLAGVKYFASHVLRDERAGPTLLFACFVGPALLVMPGWSMIGDRVGKRAGYTIASLTFTAGAAGVAGASASPAVVYLLIAVVGVGYAGQQMFGLSMLADCIAYDAARTRRRQAGVFTGVWTAGETLGLALGPGIYALVLQLSGYASSRAGQAAAQPAGARLGILVGFTLVPAVIMAAALLPLRRYDLDERRLAAAAPALPPAGIAAPALPPAGIEEPP